MTQSRSTIASERVTPVPRPVERESPPEAERVSTQIQPASTYDTTPDALRVLSVSPVEGVRLDLPSDDGGFRLQGTPSNPLPRTTGSTPDVSVSPATLDASVTPEVASPTLLSAEFAANAELGRVLAGETTLGQHTGGRQRSAVRMIQRALGIDDDGIYGGGTAAAVAGFQFHHFLAADRPRDGIVDAETLTEIDAAARGREIALQHLHTDLFTSLDVSRTTGDVLSGEITLGRAETAPPGQPAPDLTEVNAIRAVQAALELWPDGVFGPATEEVVRTFQTAHGLAPTGRVDARTLEALDVHSLERFEVLQAELESLAEDARGRSSRYRVVVTSGTMTNDQRAEASERGEDVPPPYSLYVLERGQNGESDRVVARYAISPGVEGDETPLGLTNMGATRLNDGWRPTPSMYARNRELGNPPPQPMPDGVRNAMGMAKVHLTGNIYLHGTPTWKARRLGGAASQGCIRMSAGNIFHFLNHYGGPGVPVETIDGNSERAHSLAAQVEAREALGASVDLGRYTAGRRFIALAMERRYQPPYLMR